MWNNTILTLLQICEKSIQRLLVMYDFITTFLKNAQIPVCTYQWSNQLKISSLQKQSDTE